MRSYLDTLHELTNRPILVSEFYMAAMENGSGNKNDSAGFPTVATQKEAQPPSQTVSLPCCVYRMWSAAEWFQFYDEPPNGRKMDGENYNFGLVDVHNRPYADVTDALARLDIPKLKSAPQPKLRNATVGVPPAPRDPMANFWHMAALKNWDRQHGFVPPATKFPMGDLYICWSPDAIYLGTYVFDIVEPIYYRDKKIPGVRPSGKLDGSTKRPKNLHCTFRCGRTPYGRRSGCPNHLAFRHIS